MILSRAWAIVDWLFIAVLAGSILHGQSPQDETPYKIGPGISSPIILSKVEPTYTRKAQKERCRGIVKIELIVTRDGKASKVHEISDPIGCGLDKSVVKAVEQWLFKPGEKNGKPVPVIVQMEVNFGLQK